MQKQIRFNELIDDVYKLVVSFLRKQVTYYNEDLVQDLVLKIYERFDKYDSSKASFPTFVYMNCKNYYIMYLRSKKEFYSLDQELDESDNVTMVDTVLDEDDLPLVKLLNNERKEYVSYIYKNVCSPLLKDYLNGMSQPELAKKYNMWQPNVSRSIKNELKKLRETYGE